MIVYFTLKDKSELCNFKQVPKILEPKNFNFHVNSKIDPILKQIYLELYDRNFTAGLDINFKADYMDENPVIEISSIIHSNFSIQLYGSGMSTFAYDKREISFYEGDSSATLYTFAGTNWDLEKEEFFNSSKVNSKLNNTKKLYLKYQIERNENCFTHDNDADREYSPEGNEPVTIKKSVEINRLKNFLSDLLLEIQQLPKTCHDSNIFNFEKTLLKEPLKLKAFYNNYADHLVPGKRLISLSYGAEGPLQHIYNEEFVYCELNENQKEAKNSEEFISQSFKGLYEIDLEINFSDEVYVLDLEPRDNFRQSLSGSRKFNLFGDNTEDKDLQKLSDEQRMQQYFDALVSKLVKLEDYDNSFKTPLFLVKRIIRKDEIKSIQKCQEKTQHSENLLEK